MQESPVIETQICSSQTECVQGPLSSQIIESVYQTFAQNIDGISLEFSELLHILSSVDTFFNDARVAELLHAGGFQRDTPIPYSEFLDWLFKEPEHEPNSLENVFNECKIMGHILSPIEGWLHLAQLSVSERNLVAADLLHDRAKQYQPGKYEMNSDVSVYNGYQDESVNEECGQISKGTVLDIVRIEVVEERRVEFQFPPGLYVSPKARAVFDNADDSEANHKKGHIRRNSKLHVLEVKPSGSNIMGRIVKPIPGWVQLAHMSEQQNLGVSSNSVEGAEANNSHRTNDSGMVSIREDAESDEDSHERSSGSAESCVSEGDSEESDETSEDIDSEHDKLLLASRQKKRSVRRGQSKYLEWRKVRQPAFIKWAYASSISSQPQPIPDTLRSTVEPSQLLAPPEQLRRSTSERLFRKLSAPDLSRTTSGSIRTFVCLDPVRERVKEVSPELRSRLMDQDVKRRAGEQCKALYIDCFLKRQALRVKSATAQSPSAQRQKVAQQANRFDERYAKAQDAMAGKLTFRSPKRARTATVAQVQRVLLNQELAG